MRGFSPSSAARGSKSSPDTNATDASTPTFGEFTQRDGQPARAGLSPPALTDDLHPAVDGEAQRILHLPQKRFRVTEFGFFSLSRPRMSMVSSAR